jgi:uncharacterized protein DUF2779
MRISKQTFLAAITCPTQGWYAGREEPEPLGPGLRWRFFTGQEIGRIAREQLGKGPTLAGGSIEAAVAGTAQAMGDRQNQIVYEATFCTADFTARADALRRNGDGWDLIEVKSGKAPEDKVSKKGVLKKGVPKDEYLDDLAYSAFVARAAGIPVVRCILMLMSREFRQGYQGNILVEVEVTEEVVNRAGAFAGQAAAVVAAINAGQRPEPTLKWACDECAFFATDCIGKGIADPLFDLPRLSEKRFAELKQFGRIGNLPEDAELTPAQQQVVAVLRAGQPQAVEEGLARLDDLKWPAYFLDFESVGPALPWFEGSDSYEAMPFQFSLHVKAGPDQPTAHYEYLAPANGDWRRELTELLIERLGTVGSVLMYSPYEKRMLGYLGEKLPDLKPALDGIVLRLFDLEPVIENGYYHPGFRGHSSIKYVLPVMVKELRYEGLAIRGGEDASGAFALMYVNVTPPDQQETERAALLAYCKLDTLAMVRVHEELVQIRRAMPRA